MALLGAASSAVIQAFETCGLSPTGPEVPPTWWATSGGDGARVKAPLPSGAAVSAISRSTEVARRLLFCLDDEEPASCSRTPRGPGDGASRGGPSWKHLPLPPPPPAAPSPWADEEPKVAGGSPVPGRRAEPRSLQPPPGSPGRQLSRHGPGASPPGRRAAAADAGGAAASPPKSLTPQQLRRSETVKRVEQLVVELFGLHDLNHNGVLEELELIKLNEKIAMLHYGRDADKRAVRDKFRTLFRSELDPHGRPVPFETFRGYMHKVLDGLDRSPAAQELILEQWVEEAKSGRLAFHCQSFQSLTDEPFRSKIEPMYT